MNCSDWQMRIATEEAGPEVERHLAECGECRAFVSDLAAIADGMRAMDADAAAYAVVRARVMEAVRPRRRFVWLYAAAAGLATACLALIWITAPLRAPAPPPPAAVVYRIAPPEWKPPVAVIPAKRRVVHRPFRTQPPAEQLTAIKLLTDDPNVVIIWLLDKKGDAL
jgi:hypothetical protein